MKNQELSEEFDIQTARLNGLVTGTMFHLTREGRIIATLRDDNLFNLEVDGDFVETGTLSGITTPAKRIENPNFSDNTNFPASRAWVTFGGKRIMEFMGNRGQKINGGSSEKTSNVNIVGQTCESCFTQVPLTGVCDFC